MLSLLRLPRLPRLLPLLFLPILPILPILVATAPACAPAAPPATATSPEGVDTLRIGTWNVQNLGDRDWGPQRPEDLAAAIRDADVDVLALQEIHDDDGVDRTRTNRTLDAVVALLDSEEDAWRYVLLPGRYPRDPQRLIGVLWNARRVQLAGDPLRIDVAYASPSTWTRHPYAIPFRAGDGRTDFAVVPLHLKSNHDGAEAARRVREDEARALAERLDAVRGRLEERDLVLLGDLNTLSHDEPAVALLLRGGFRDLNADDRPTHWTRRFGPRPLDRILVPAAQPEFADSTLTILEPRDPADHTRRLSDHWLLVTTLRVGADDD